MFIYLSKKIAIPNGVKLHTVSWYNDQGWIACGGDEGLLKVLKLETPVATTEPNNYNSRRDPTSTSAAGQGAGSTGTGQHLSNLSMNQTLEGHTGAVVVSTWNQQHRKLTTSDQQGLIIVWILYKGIWYEEMINNRNKSTVSDMQWNRDGQKICIAYEDGAVIVGSVDGNRLWGKELKCQLAHVQWSPDGKNILFGTSTGELHLYDSSGNFVSKVPCYGSESAGLLKIAALDWYNGSNGYIEPRAPCLAICFENGKIQIMRDEKDSSPMVLDTNLRHLKMKWNNNGSILAVAGVQHARSAQGDEKEVSVVHFYDSHGQYVRSLKVPGKRITSLSWEYSGLRIALAVDSFIYFANIRPDYRWSFFASDVLVYTYTKSERTDTNIVFWNSKTNEKNTKNTSKLVALASSGDYCVLVTKIEELSEQYQISVVNSIGTSIESKQIDFEPRFAAINKTHVFVASSDIVMYWQFRSSVLGSKLSAIDETKERAFHVDDMSVIGTRDSGSFVVELKKKRPSSDSIVSATASDSTFVLARQSGQLLQFVLPSMTLENKYSTGIRTQFISLNCNSSRLAMLDTAGLLKIFEFDRKGGALAPGGSGAATNISGGAGGASGGSVGVPAGTSPADGSSGSGSTMVGGLVGSKQQLSDSGKLLDFERKDVWDVRWAEDNPELFAIMEKTRMYVFRNLDPEEPITCSGYICGFDKLQIKAVLLDELLKDPEGPSKEHIINMETKSLRDTRNILSQVGIADALQFVEDNPHPRLWKLIADASLEELDFTVAQKALIRCTDYQGIQFIKRLQKYDDKMKQRAEIEAYFGHHDAAEKIYLEMDRKDLAIDLRIRLGDWFRVIQLIKSGGSGGDDIVLEKAWNAIGDYYFDRQRWSQSITYYTQGRSNERLIECFYFLDDYENLEKMIYQLPDGDPLLRNLADKFVTVGMCEQAVAAFVKINDIQAAIDTCIYLSQWNTAVELAEAHKFKEIEPLLAKYASHLLQSNRVIEAIELYRKANACEKSAKLLFDLAKTATKANKSPLCIKKLYVLAALEVEAYHKLHKSGKGLGRESVTAALDGLLEEDKKNTMDGKFLENAWRGAEAYHFYLLCQRQYYSGNFEGAVNTASVLRDYEDILDPEVIYCLLALVSIQAKQFGTCSRALVKLEALSTLSEDTQASYERLALSIFTQYPPVDPKGTLVSCTNCAGSIRDNQTFCNHCHIAFPTCIASGRPIIEAIHFMCHCHTSL
ncbi:uncharacterized protein BJ171DRAFT_588781 [Polychytrium aggregatum]|uniref:uncharacterized protein n=1 Tax=Polychytrium aggregatum TaxID=110093 RepID=UPI0022FE049D|nr:uncharacterized protein BJ171DRAFT_588781 [Polychytrium aggregatum]KAI9193226.1 hypothetical protein BJ171DRAFT_588781 [Polychytrium aggregatum]